MANTLFDYFLGHILQQPPDPFSREELRPIDVKHLRSWLIGSPQYRGTEGAEVLLRERTPESMTGSFPDLETGYKSLEDLIKKYRTSRTYQAYRTGREGQYRPVSEALKRRRRWNPTTGRYE